MAKLIRSCLAETTKAKMNGVIEMDETFIGGRKKLDKNGNKGIGDKAIVFGMRNRETKEVRLFHIEKKDKSTMLRIVEDNIEKGATIYTDKYAVYLELGTMGYDHKVIGSKRRKSEVHTNSIETVWSYLKIPMRSTHRHISAKHLQTYLDEQAFKYNHRDISFVEFVKIIIS